MSGISDDIYKYYNIILINFVTNGKAQQRDPQRASPQALANQRASMAESSGQKEKKTSDEKSKGCIECSKASRPIETSRPLHDH